MSVSTSQWFSVESPQAWIPQCTSSRNHLFSNVQDYINQDYTASPLEEWFKLPSNCSTSALNWNDFVPSGGGGTSMSPSGGPRTPVAAESYLDSSIWDPAPFQSTPPMDFTAATAPASPGETYPSGYPCTPLGLLSPRNLDIEVELSRQNLYKTELCRSWVESSICKYGNKCQFAHGQHELRPVIRHPKYKTEICKTFHTNGTCPYGRRCRFVHNPAELRSQSSSSESLESLPPFINPSSSETKIKTMSMKTTTKNTKTTSGAVGIGIGIGMMDEEMRQLQERFKLANIAPDPVFYPSQTFIPLAQQQDYYDDEVSAGVLDDVSSPHSGGSFLNNHREKGSGLPIFQKLRKQKI